MPEGGSKRRKECTIKEREIISLNNGIIGRNRVKKGNQGCI